MMQMSLTELTCSATVCGICLESSKNLSTKAVSSVLSHYQYINYLAYCMIDKSSMAIALYLQEIRKELPYIRIAMIGNTSWYSKNSIKQMNDILLLRDEADVYVHCPYPFEDYYYFFAMCCDYLLCDQSMIQRTFINKMRRANPSLKLIEL